MKRQYSIMLIFLGLLLVEESAWASSACFPVCDGAEDSVECRNCQEGLGGPSPASAPDSGPASVTCACSFNCHFNQSQTPGGNVTGACNHECSCNDGSNNTKTESVSASKSNVVAQVTQMCQSSTQNFDISNDAANKIFNPSIRDVCAGAIEEASLIAGVPDPVQSDTGAVATGLKQDSCPSGDKNCSKSSGTSPDCKEALTNAQKECRGGGTGGAVGNGFDTAGSLATRAAADMKSACMAIKAGAAAAMGSMTARQSSCGIAAGECSSKCSSNRYDRDDGTYVLYMGNLKQSDTCDGMGMDMVFAGAAGGMQLYGAKLTADQCDKYLEDMNANNCQTGSKASDNPLCVDKYCANPAHTADQMCQNVKCLDVAKAKNDPSCVAVFCAYNVSDPRCTGNPAPTVPNAAPTMLTRGESGAASGLPETNSQNFGSSQHAQEQGLASDGGGGGAGLGAGGGYAGGSGGGAGGGGKSAGPKRDTDILKGFLGGAGGFIGGMVSRTGLTNTSVGQWLNKLSNQDQRDEEARRKELEKYLSQQRSIASVADASKGITASNGPSNFEKISRHMATKRPYLKP